VKSLLKRQDFHTTPYGVLKRPSVNRASTLGAIAKALETRRISMFFEGE
jgi:hypothetical protein